MIIENLLLDEIQTRTGIATYPKVPANMPGQFYVISKTGSTFENQIHTSTIAIQSYGKTQLETATMNENVKDAMLSLISLDEISAVAINSDYIYTDTSEKKDRYQAGSVITHY